MTDAAAVVTTHGADLDLLTEYDRGTLRPNCATIPVASLNASDVVQVVAALRERFPYDSRLGVPRVGSLASVVGQVEQTFMGEPVYPTVEERAANLLYFVVKNHPFEDGNKRTAAALFAYYLGLNGINAGAAVPGHTLAAIVLLAASSDPAHKDDTITLIRALISNP